ncbi:MAG: CCA tRNA nucleotidyltransferase [Candidatus Acidiferrum sp.]|jgi:poly(A) polymerase
MPPRELANSICATLQRHGHEAFLVGGCVRDVLVGREPTDYDVATNALPERVLQLFPQSLAVGAQFGVVQVLGTAGKVEVATFRREVGYSDGRHPDQVVFTSNAEEDVSRRDFTINGLLMRHYSGEVLDFVGGQADLDAHIIRSIGDAERRFTEDKLRMLRAVRFAARFGFTIEPKTFAAIQLHAPEIDSVSAERIREELSKLLTEGAARRGFEWLDQTDLLRQVLPEVSALKGVPQPPEYHPEGDVWIHTLMMLEGLPPEAPRTLAWGALLHDVGKPVTFRPVSVTGDRIRFDGHVHVGVRISAEICKRLKFSNEESEQIQALVANHMKFKDVAQMKKSTLKRFVRQPHFDEHMALHRLDCLASHKRLDAYDMVRKFLNDTPPEEVKPTRLLTGDDLSEMGYVPGPGFQTILRALEDAQLDGSLSTRDEAESFVWTNYPLAKNSR